MHYVLSLLWYAPACPRSFFPLCIPDRACPGVCVVLIHRGVVQVVYLIRRPSLIAFGLLTVERACLGSVFSCTATPSSDLGLSLLSVLAGLASFFFCRYFFPLDHLLLIQDARNTPPHAICPCLFIFTPAKFLTKFRAVPLPDTNPSSIKFPDAFFLFCFATCHISFCSSFSAFQKALPNALRSELSLF